MEATTPYYNLPYKEQVKSYTMYLQNLINNAADTKNNLMKLRNSRSKIGQIP